METLLQGFLFNIGHISPWIIYIYFFISAVLQITVPPYPGDTILIFGGYLGSIGMKAGNMPIFISYLLGTIISSVGLYVLGVRKGDSVLKFRLISKYFSPVYQSKAQKCLIKYGIIIFFVCKFIPGLNSLIIIFGGVLKYNPLWACIGVGMASLVHNIIFFLIGRSIGDNIDGIKAFLSTYNSIVTTLMVLGIILYIGFKSYKNGKLFKR